MTRARTMRYLPFSTIPHPSASDGGRAAAQAPSEHAFPFHFQEHEHDCRNPNPHFQTEKIRSPVGRGGGQHRAVYRCTAVATT
uniref:Uncharacterized protein n=1 Tax=Conchiformibius kuhniae TaxID=211502 RepID=A0A8T9MWB3_9NEIS|nr:hypothetical protein LVJ77_02275 [Conchiformibius kuhniae]